MVSGIRSASAGSPEGVRVRVLTGGNVGVFSSEASVMLLSLFSISARGSSWKPEDHGRDPQHHEAELGRRPRGSQPIRDHLQGRGWRAERGTTEGERARALQL